MAGVEVTHMRPAESGQHDPFTPGLNGPDYGYISTISCTYAEDSGRREEDEAPGPTPGYLHLEQALLKLEGLHIVPWGIALIASTQQKPKKLEVMKLLKSLGKSGQFDEANNEANRNLVSKKSKEEHIFILEYSIQLFSAWLNGPADGTFPVAQVALLFLGLELDEDAFLSLKHHIKFDKNAFQLLAKACQSMDTDQNEERLAKILGAPMEYLLQLGKEEEARQWRLLKVEGKFFKLLSEDSPDGGILYKACGMKTSPPNFDLTWHDDDDEKNVQENETIEVVDDSGDNYKDPKPSSPILAPATMNVWDLSHKLEYFTTN
ncbi:hypothetical protein BT96DRAFT_1002992 [Gymnopus androsaceus JB14]|uniref:Uncharacterized protein n=1 Tax=Gymnopus androsaceus JB14 TaxID=1447944 RepID=A0A6A4GXD6_9AGAR|nr:hypothetical protein BT96DRAFT_1002992 [Gymnopus androsaceus JB14]